MKIEYFKSAICPRCAVVTRTLDELAQQDADLEIERVEIFAHPSRTWGAGVRQIPALRIDGQVQSWFRPKKEEVLAFIEARSK